MSSAVAFPAVKPNSRTFVPGEYPSNTFESLDGTKTHLRYGNKRVNSTLELGFTNITDGQVGLILENYDNVNSDWDYVKFTTDNGALGIDDPGSGHYLTKEIRSEDGTGKTRQGLKWRYSKPPKVTSVYPGISNVTCSFVACLDAP
jgi:hypothetical protein